MNELTEQGIAVLKAGNRDAARRLLSAAVKQNPDDAQAWLWLTGTVDNDRERMACLNHVLRIDPGNQVAIRAIAKLRTQAELRAQNDQPAATQPGADRPNSSTKSSVSDEPLPPAVSAAAPASSKAKRNHPQDAPTAAPQSSPMPQSARLVFRTRPSSLPALLCFWLFLFGAYAIGALLMDSPLIGLPLAAGIGILLELIVLYVLIRNMSVQYELTTYQLTYQSRGKRAQILIPNLLNVELAHSFLQRLLGIGDIEIDAAVNGQLAHLRLRNIPRCRLRFEQLRDLVRKHGTA